MLPECVHFRFTLIGIAPPAASAMRVSSFGYFFTARK
jgi:hypothetical protein